MKILTSANASGKFLIPSKFPGGVSKSVRILDTSRKYIEVRGVWTDDSIELSLSFSDVLDGIVETEGFPTREDTILLEIELGTSISFGRTQEPPLLSSKLA